MDMFFHSKQIPMDYYYFYYLFKSIEMLSHLLSIMITGLCEYLEQYVYALVFYKVI